jgi:hypothetical protein
LRVFGKLGGGRTKTRRVTVAESHDILINVFWPMVSLEEPDAAQIATAPVWPAKCTSGLRSPGSNTVASGGGTIPSGLTCDGNAPR